MDPTVISIIVIVSFLIFMAAGRVLQMELKEQLTLWWLVKLLLSVDMVMLVRDAVNQ